MLMVDEIISTTTFMLPGLFQVENKFGGWIKVDAVRLNEICERVYKLRNVVEHGWGSKASIGEDILSTIKVNGSDVFQRFARIVTFDS